MFLGINRHYRRFARRLRAGLTAARATGTPENTTLLWVDSIDVATEGALWYSRLIEIGRASCRERVSISARPGARQSTGPTRRTTPPKAPPGLHAADHNEVGRETTH